MVRLPKYAFPASLVGTAIGIAVIIKDRSQGLKYKGEHKFSGKTAIITGANSGLGKATATELARRGGKVILACRNLKSAYEVRDEIITETYNRNVEVKHLDLASLESVAAFAKDINANEMRVDVIVNNAGVMAQGRRRQVTNDGFEMCLGVNYLGAFLLTNLLLPKLLQSGQARVINLVTISMNKSAINFEDLNSAKDYDPYVAYGQSKLALMSFTHQLAKQYSGSGLEAYAVYPGVAQTNLARGLSSSTVSSTVVGSPMSLFMRRPENAIQSIIYCCLEPDINDKSGRCIKDLRAMDWKTQLSDFDSVRLWKISEKWTRLDEYRQLIGCVNG